MKTFIPTSTTALTTLAVSIMSMGVSLNAQAAALAANSAYYKDPQSEYVQDATTDRIGGVNMIMCIVSALRADAMVNSGNYVALVDLNKCASDRANPTQSSGSSGVTQEYIRAVVNASRASNGEPMRIKAWLEEKGDIVHVNVSVSEAPSASNPYGSFRVDYCLPADDKTCQFAGVLQAGANGVTYYEKERDGTTALRLLNSSDADTGSGAISLVRGQATPSNDLFAYNATHFYRNDGQDNYCFDRKKDKASSSVWRYGLYNDTGARHERNAGFPVKYSKDGKSYQGYIGYYGLFMPDGVIPQDGDTLAKQSAGDTQTNYTFRKYGGRLIKYSSITSNLSAIDKVRFTAGLWTFRNDPVEGGLANASDITFDDAAKESGAQLEMYWDDQSGAFKGTGLMSCGNSGCFNKAFNGNAEKAVTVTGNLQGGTGFSGWSQSLGGQIFISLGGDAPSSQTVVTRRVESLVYPADYPENLTCISECLDGAKLTPRVGELFGGGTPFFEGNGYVFQTLVTDAKLYSFKDNVLTDKNNAAVVSQLSTSDLENTAYARGIRSGPMVASPDGAKCDHDDTYYCREKIEAGDYYVWETGPNNWNQFKALQDSNGSFLKFDAPQSVSFKVPTGAAYGVYQGSTLNLQYGGFGDLWGIPGHCVDPSNNQPAQCGPNARYVPEFSIPYDTNAGVVKSGATNYYVKWLDRELRLSKVDNAVCTGGGLSLPAIGQANLVLPTQNDLRNPTDPNNSTVFIDSMPVVAGNPKVIHGVVQQ